MQHRPVPQTEFVKLNQFSASRMLWAARNALEAHEKAGLGAEPSADALRNFMPQVSAHISLRKAVIANTGKPTNPELQLADRKVDVTYSRFHGRVMDTPVLYGDDSPQGRAAHRLLNGPLALPVASVTNVDRVEEEALLKEIIHDIEANHLADVQTLELVTHFELLKHDADAFFREMTIDASRPQLPTRTQLEEERKHLQAQMIACILRVLGKFPEPTEADLKMRTLLLSPFAIQNDKISEYYRNRRNSPNSIAPEIDPDSGEEFPETEQATEQEATSAPAPQPTHA